MSGIDFAAHLFSVICAKTSELSEITSPVTSCYSLLLADGSSCYHIAQDALENTVDVTVNYS